jgi:hypothetical protein
VREGPYRKRGYTLGAKGPKRKAVELATDPVAPQQSKLVVEFVRAKEQPAVLIQCGCYDICREYEVVCGFPLA